jgi:hypothetical protein
MLAWVATKSGRSLSLKETRDTWKILSVFLVQRSRCSFERINQIHKKLVAVMVMTRRKFLVFLPHIFQKVRGRVEKLALLGIKQSRSEPGKFRKWRVSEPSNLQIVLKDLMKLTKIYGNKM